PRPPPRRTRFLGGRLGPFPWVPGYIPNLVRPPGSAMDQYATLAAGIAIAGGLIGTGMAQSGIGAAGMGIIAEKPEKFGQVLFFFVIRESLWIIGFVLGIILLLGVIS